MSAESSIEVNGEAIHDRLDAEGYAYLPGLLDASEMTELARLAVRSASWRPMPSEGMGKGDVTCLTNEVSSRLQTLRQALFHGLVPLANRWNVELGLADAYPGSFDEFDEAFNREGGTTAYMHRLGADDYLALQQCTGNSGSFPFQVVALASQPGVDFDGGEFVLTERRPRMQSRPAVIPLQAGDAAVICTSYRAAKGSRGFFRTEFKHAVSTVHKGTRLGLHLSFHDIPWPTIR